MVKLTKEDKEYIGYASKMIPYDVSIEDRFISVPQGQELEAKENLSVQHLINKFNFSIQSAIGLEPKKVYDPVLRTNPIKSDQPKEVFTMPKKGEIWLDEYDKSRKYFDWVKEGKYRVKFLGEMRPDRTFIEQEIINLIKNGSLKIELK
jgi:hypothetical protein